MAFARLVLGVGFAAALACSFVAPAEARPARSARGKAPSGIEFLMRSAAGNLSAIRMGELAQRKGQNEGLRSFGEQLAADHAEANQRIATLAESLKLALPREPGPRHQSQYALVSAFSGPAFDRQFLNSTITTHTRAIVDYQRATGRKGDAADYARETLPMLQRHLRAAERLMRNLRWTGEPRK